MLSSVLLLVTPWTVAHQVPLSVEFCRQEYWSGLPFSTPGNLPHPGIEPVSPALAGGLFTITVTWGDLSFQHKHNHFNTYVYVCVFEPMNKQTKKTKNLYWVPFLAKKRHPNALKGTWPKVPLCEVYSFLTAGERGKMTVMIFRGGLGRLEEQTSR